MAVSTPHPQVQHTFLLREGVWEAEGQWRAGVAAMARRLGKRIVGIGGIIEWSDAVRSHFDDLIEVKPSGMSVNEAIANAAELLEEAVAGFGALVCQE